MGRAPCCDKANVKKGPWSPEEDAKLKAYIEKYGTGGNWIALPQKIGLKRCGKSCRLRWLNYLRPNIKHGGFSEEEDNIICSLYISIGSRWSIIAAQLPGRTDNDIKNYWNTRLKKKLLGRRKQSNGARLSSSASPDDHLKDTTGLEDGPHHETLSSSALERLQLHMQLQSLQNPLSFYNNPALWPKLHPFQQKMIQSFQAALNNGDPNNAYNNPLLQTNLMISNPPNHDHHPADQQTQKLDNLYHQNSSITDQDYAKIDDNPKISDTNAFNPIIDHSANTAHVANQGDHHHGTTNTIVEESQNNTAGNSQQVSAFQAELEDILNGEAVIGFVPQDQGDNHHHHHHHQNMADFDCFKEMNNVSKDSLMWWSNAFEAKSSSTSNSWENSTTAALHDQSNGILFHEYDQLSYGL